MLPFLNNKKMMTTIMKKQDATGAVKPAEEVMDSSNDMQMAAQDLLSAIESKDVSAIAEALQSAFAIADGQEDEEEE